MISAIRMIYKATLFLIVAMNLHAQVTFNEQFNYSKKLYDEERYFDAVTEFKRLSFFDKADRFAFEVNKYLGLCYKQGAKFSDAIFHFTMAERNAITVDDVFNTKIEIIKVNILRRSTGRALVLLDSLYYDIRFKEKKDDVSYWRGWAYIFADDWENASLSFESVSPDHKLKAFADSIKNEFYNVNLATVLSVFIPGAGQFYTGEYISGLISLGWNMMWGYLTISAFVDDRVFDGFMIGSLLWWRFYTGNLQNAEKFAVEKNLNITNDALRYLKNDYSGLKP